VRVGNGISMGMAWVPPGNFMMGQADIRGATKHRVTLTRGFHMGMHPVTQEQFHAVMGANPSDFSGNPAAGDAQRRRPVETVSWYHAIAFANRLSILQELDPVYGVTGTSDWMTVTVPTTDSANWNNATPNWGANGFRLATEAEWEFAARAGTTTQWSFGATDANVDRYAWTHSNASGTREVGLLKPNAWGLHDMHGNVWEWVWDRWSGALDANSATNPEGAVSGDTRVIRGGGWDFPPEGARSAFRLGCDPDFRGCSLGFRVARAP